MALKKTIEVEAKTGKAEKNVKDLDKSIKKLDKSVEGLGDEAKETGTDLEKGMNKGAGGVKKLALGFKALGVAIKAAGIGLVIAAFSQFKELFAGDTLTDTLTLAAETVNGIFSGKGFSQAYADAKATLGLRKQIELSEKEFQKTQLIAQASAEKERQIRDDVSISLRDRIAANERLGVLLKEQLKDELALAKINVGFLASENKKLSTQASALALADAEIKVLEIKERLVSQESEQKTNAVALQNELNQLILTEAELNEGQLVLRSAMDVHEIARIESRKTALDEDFERQMAFNEWRLEQETEGTQAYADILKERKDLDEDYQRESIALADAARAAKITLVQDLGNAIIEVFGKTSAVGKAVALAQAIWNVQEGITKALTLAPPWSFILAATTALKGYAAIKNIVKTPVPAGVGGGGGGSVPSIDVQAPQFNIVGDTGINQLAKSLSVQQGIPIKAFVVSKDVRTADELDRNRIGTATFG